MYIQLDTVLTNLMLTRTRLCPIVTDVSFNTLAHVCDGGSDNVRMCVGVCVLAEGLI